MKFSKQNLSPIRERRMRAAVPRAAVPRAAV
jgi:hypothetical protein